MINSLLNLHFYLILNCAIGIAYIISRITLNLPFLTTGILQWQRLKYTRYCLIFTIIIFLFIPHFFTLIPAPYRSNFQIEPMLGSSSSYFLSHKTTITASISTSPNEYTVSLSQVLMSILLLGIGIFLIRYIRNIIILNTLRKKSFCQHKIAHIQILFNNQCTMPFCWGYLKNHFILFPHSMLENNNDLKLAIRHELQHIRQGDTHWIHFMAIMKAICFCNPFVWLWSNLFEELQELSCDESIILRNKSMSAFIYAQSLVNAANDYLNHIPSVVLGVHKLPKSFLYRRVNMLFNYKSRKPRKISLIFAYSLLLASSISAAAAFNGGGATTSLSINQVSNLVQEKHINKNFLVEVKPEVVNEINNIRNSEQARSVMYESLQRMKQYQPIIQKMLKEEVLPNDLLVIPLVESGYQPLEQKKNPILAAGIWQIIPETAKRLGLIVNNNRDDRLNTELATKAAISYLKANYAQFQDWKLALVAYEIGEKNTDRLMKETGSRDVWVLANASSAPKQLKKFLIRLESSLIIMHNPSLVN